MVEKKALVHVTVALNASIIPPWLSSVGETTMGLVTCVDQMSDMAVSAGDALGNIIYSVS